MPKNRILPTIAIAVSVPVWAWAQSGSPAPAPAPASDGVPVATPGVPTEAETVLDIAIAKVAALNAVSANLLETVSMLGQRFEVKGRYLKAPKDRVYLLLEVSGLADAQGKMLQVCDGETLWDYQQVFETKIFHKFRIAQILEKLKSPDLDPPLREQVTTQLGMAGPDVLLVGLRRAVRFDQKEERTLDGRPVWVLGGSWLRPEGLIGPNLTPQQQMAPLPSFVPSLVKVYLGREDGWPYKVVLVGRPPSILMEDTRPIGPDGRRIGSLKLIQKPLVTKIELIYSDVMLNPALQDGDFAFQAPAGVRVEDGTDVILDILDKAVQSKIAQKKAEAAAAEPLLNQSIDVPKTRSEPSGFEPPSDAPR